MRRERIAWIGALWSVAGFCVTLGDTALVEAVKNHDKEAVRSLLKQHANVNATEADGTTALHWAAHQDDLEVVQLLVRAGAKVNAPNKQGLTPLDVANGKGGAPGQYRMPNESTAALLRQLGGTPGKEVKEAAKADYAVETARRRLA